MFLGSKEEGIIIAKILQRGQKKNKQNLREDEALKYRMRKWHRREKTYHSLLQKTYLLSIYYMLGTVPDPWHIYVKKTNKEACPYGVYILEKLMGGM